MTAWTLYLTNWRQIDGIRIIWYYEGDKMIILVDVGHHDILKQF